MNQVQTVSDMPLRRDGYKLSDETIMGCERNGTRMRFRRGFKFLGVRFSFPVSRNKFLQGFKERRLIHAPSDITLDHLAAFVKTDVRYTDGSIFYLVKKG